MITISYFWMNAHVVALASPPNVVLLGGATWTLEPDHSHGEDGHHGVERHGHRHHAEQVKVVTDPEERSSRLPPTGLASSWIAANEKVKNKRKLLHLFLQTVSSHTSSASNWLSIWVVSMPGLSSFLFSTISAHITYNFCFMCCRRWYRLHRVPQSSQTEKFWYKFQNEIHKSSRESLLR